MRTNPPATVGRRPMATEAVPAEIVRATRRERLGLHFCAPLHLLALYEQGARCKLAFVPAGHEYSDWQEPKMLLRAVCFYFEPTRMPGPSEALTPRMFFEDA